MDSQSEEDTVEAPQKIEPKGMADYLSVMTKSVFQSGISWKVVESKWPGIVEALRGFDVEAVAGLTEADLDALTADKRVIRNRRKLEAIVHNAGKMLELSDKHGGFREYLRSQDDFEATVKDLKKQFKFLGDMGTYHFLWVVNEEVPAYEDWCASRGVQPMTH